MIWNYNGKGSRIAMRNLKVLIKICDDNKKTLLDELKKQGKICFFENLDWFLEEPFKFKILESENEIDELLKEVKMKKINEYLCEEGLQEDYLLKAVVDYIDKKGKLPPKNEMIELEKEAEQKRISKSSLKNAKTKKPNDKNIAKEILELSYEIIEARKESRPEDIVTSDYFENLFVKAPGFSGEILLERNDFALKQLQEYSCFFKIKHNKKYIKILIEYYDDIVDITVRDKHGEIVKPFITGELITIHEGLVELAKKEGLKFEPEININK